VLKAGVLPGLDVASEGLNGHECEVVNQVDFFLHERLAVADPCQESVVAGFGKGALANLFFRNKEGAAGGLVGVLGAVRHEGAVTLFNERRYVHDEGGTDVRVEAGIDDLEGAMGWSARVDFCETREEAGLIAEGGGNGVVGMARLPIGKDHDAGAEMAQNVGDLHTIFEGIFDCAVGKVESLASGNTEEAGCFSGFLSSFAGGAAGSGFALRKVEDGGAEAAGGHAEEGAAAGLFYVVAVGGDGQDVGG